MLAARSRGAVARRAFFPALRAAVVPRGTRGARPLSLLRASPSARRRLERGQWTAGGRDRRWRKRSKRRGRAVKIPRFVTPSGLAKLCHTTVSMVHVAAREAFPEWMPRRRAPTKQLKREAAFDGDSSVILSFDEASAVAEAFGCVPVLDDVDPDEVEVDGREHRPDERPRVAAACMLGHVDHGKTTLLDALRGADVASREKGGITQDLYSFQVPLGGVPGGQLTFLDTPGHEEFASMRQHGAFFADVAVLVVACDEGVCAQTEEGIEFAADHGLPLVVALTKTDAPGARPDEARAEVERALGAPLRASVADALARAAAGEHGAGPPPPVAVAVEVSARTGHNLDALRAALRDAVAHAAPRCDLALPTHGAVLEAFVDRGRGRVVRAVLRDGVLREGDHFVAAEECGRVRAMHARGADGKLRRVREAEPGVPVEVMGLRGDTLPLPGEMFETVPTAERAARVAEVRKLGVMYALQRRVRDALADADEDDEEERGRIARGELRPDDLGRKAEALGAELATMFEGELEDMEREEEEEEERRRLAVAAAAAADEDEAVDLYAVEEVAAEAGEPEEEVEEGEEEDDEDHRDTEWWRDDDNFTQPHGTDLFGGAFETTPFPAPAPGEEIVYPGVPASALGRGLPRTATATPAAGVPLATGGAGGEELDRARLALHDMTRMELYEAGYDERPVPKRNAMPAAATWDDVEGELAAVFKAPHAGALHALLCAVEGREEVNGRPMRVAPFASGTGAVTKNDVAQAMSRGACVYAYRVPRPRPSVARMAEQYRVPILAFDVIHDLDRLLSEAEGRRRAAAARKERVAAARRLRRAGGDTAAYETDRVLAPHGEEEFIEGGAGDATK